MGDRQPEPLVLPRGLPSNHSHAITKDFYQPVRYPGDDLWGPYESVSLEDATRWVVEGRSRFVDSGGRANGLVSVPDWHTPGWLLESEVTAAIAHIGRREQDLSVEFRAILTLMRYLEGELGPGCTRIVFWFDN